ncbi:hypothetical protein [Streptomyces mirabilis]|uniref:hypothetical protein n=1 Tax=Streptomyces mirabilis TaxID=68239 RepID=UPI003F4C0584
MSGLDDSREVFITPRRFGGDLCYPALDPGAGEHRFPQGVDGVCGYPLSRMHGLASLSLELLVRKTAGDPVVGAHQDSDPGRVVDEIPQLTISPGTLHTGCGGRNPLSCSITRAVSATESPWRGLGTLDEIHHPGAVAVCGQAACGGRGGFFGGAGGAAARSKGVRPVRVLG